MVCRIGCAGAFAASNVRSKYRPCAAATPKVVVVAALQRLLVLSDTFATISSAGKRQAKAELLRSLDLLMLPRPATWLPSTSATRAAFGATIPFFAAPGSARRTPAIASCGARRRHAGRTMRDTLFPSTLAHSVDGAGLLTRARAVAPGAMDAGPSGCGAGRADHRCIPYASATTSHSRQSRSACVRVAVRCSSSRIQAHQQSHSDCIPAHSYTVSTRRNVRQAGRIVASPGYHSRGDFR